MENFKKLVIPIMAGLLAICAALVLGSIMFPPKTGKAPEEMAPKKEEDAISTETLQIQSLTRRIEAAESNIKKIYNNQLELSRAIGELTKSQEGSRKTEKDNRAYLAMMYQKMLDMELRLENVGGGFNVRQKPQEEQVNPLMGTDTLPSPNP